MSDLNAHCCHVIDRSNLGMHEVLQRLYCPDLLDLNVLLIPTKHSRHVFDISPPEKLALGSLCAGQSTCCGKALISGGVEYIGSHMGLTVRIRN